MARPTKENSMEKKSFPEIITSSKEGSVMVMTPDEYREWSKSQGRIMGRLPNQVTFPTEEEMRILINSGYTRAMVKEKHGLSDEQINELLVRMSNKERRDRVVVLH